MKAPRVITRQRGATDGLAVEEVVVLPEGAQDIRRVLDGRHSTKQGKGEEMYFSIVSFIHNLGLSISSILGTRAKYFVNYDGEGIAANEVRVSLR